MVISNINLIEVQREQTIDDFLQSESIVDKTFTTESFINLALYDDQNITNADKIFNLYSAKELSSNETLTGSSIIKLGTQVGIPNSVKKRDTTYTIPQEISQLTDFKPFMANALRKLLKDPNYYSEIKSQSGEILGKVDINDISVYAWIRSSSSLNVNSEGQWYNISPFVEALRTTVSKDGGQFDFTLSSVSGVYDLITGWNLDNLKGYSHTSLRDDILSTSITSKHKNKLDNFLSREDFFFNTVMQENDLIYIRFEKLAAEQELDLKNKIFGPTDIPGKIYDMIGLVDNVSIGQVAQTNGISVQGRDLMKVLIEDGSYFFVEAFAQNIFTDKDSLLNKRNVVAGVEGGLMSYSYTFKTIETILKFIFNKFSNIGYVKNTSLNGYGDKLLKGKYNLKQSALANEGVDVIDQINKDYLQEERQGIWRLIDLVFDPESCKRVLADNGIAMDNGSLINSIRKICQDPFVEFYGDTYGDKYNFIVRKPPFDERGYKGMVYDNVVSEDLLTSGIQQQDRLRKDLFEKDFNFKNDNGRPSSLSDIVIDIDETEVLSDEFVYSKEAYSWYRIIPRGLGIKDDGTGFQLIPILPIDEYASIWGNKMLTIEYNYSPIEFIDDSQRPASQDYAQRQAFLDLQYLVQSHIYLPFTRQGTINILGNRTIKMGMFIYYKPTDEVFHVDSVTNIKTLNNRSTILQVSRGMKEKYIKGIKVKFASGEKLVSYFTVLPTPIKNDASLNDIKFLKNWKIDLDVMNFFIQRRQWSN